MYSKIKYLIYGSFFLFFILLFAAIQQSSMVADKKAQEKIEKDMISKVEKYQKVAEERNRNQMQAESQTSRDIERTPIISPEPETPLSNNIEKSNNGNIHQTNKSLEELEIENSALEQKTEKLYFASNNKEASEYILCKRFQFDGNNYAIVAFDDTRYASEYSKYVNRKFYIYKENEQNLVNIHYLFERSVKKDDKSIPDFSVTVNKYDAKITYNSKPPVSRTISSNILINARNQYNTPELTTGISDSSEITDNRELDNSKTVNETNDTNSSDFEMIKIPNLPQN